MRLYQGGDFFAFELLYKRHSGRVFDYLKRKSSPEVAKDLTQEVFEKLHKSRSKYDPQYPLLPWIFTISRNAFFDFCKRAETRIVHASSSDEILLGSIAAPGPAVASIDLPQTLESLPALQRRAIELRYLQDWSFEQIAKDLETTEDNARQLISRGLKKVRKLVSRNGDSNES